MLSVEDDCAPFLCLFVLTGCCWGWDGEGKHQVWLFQRKFPLQKNSLDVDNLCKNSCDVHTLGKNHMMWITFSKQFTCYFTTYKYCSGFQKAAWVPRRLISQHQSPNCMCSWRTFPLATWIILDEQVAAQNGATSMQWKRSTAFFARLMRFMCRPSQNFSSWLLWSDVWQLLRILRQQLEAEQHLDADLIAFWVLSQLLEFLVRRDQDYLPWLTHWTMFISLAGNKQKFSVSFRVQEYSWKLREQQKLKPNPSAG